MQQFIIDVNKGKQTGVGEHLARPVTTDPFNAGLNTDVAATGVNNPAGVMQLITQVYRMEEVDPVDC